MRIPTVLLYTSAVILGGIVFVPSHTLAGIIQAIVPAAVPVANKTGNSAKFQLGSGAVTNGHCGSFDGNGNLVDSGVACSSSGAGTPGSTLFSSTTQAGPDNTNAQTSVIGSVSGATTIPANTFTNGAILEVRAQGYYSLPAVADSLTLRVKCGGTVLASGVLTPPAGAVTNGTWRMWLTITSIGTGAGGSFMTNGMAGLVGSALSPSEAAILNTANVAYDFTTTCVMDVTAQWGAAQVGELITGTNVAAWIPGAPVTSVNGMTGAVTTTGAATPSATPTNYYIATTGNDSNVCSVGSKCLTLAHALSLVPTIIDHPFIINVADGSYAEPINLAGFITSQQGSIKILGNTTTPANVTFTGTVSCNFPDSLAPYTVDACLPTVNAILSGLKMSGAGTSRGLLAYAGNVLLDNFTMASTSTFAGIQVALRGTLGMTGVVVVNSFGSAATGLYGNQSSYIGQYGGTVTITGATGNNTQTGIGINANTVYDMHQGAAGSVHIFGVQTGIFLGRGSQFINLISTAVPSISITNIATPTASTGIYASANATYQSNPGSLSMDHFTTCLLTDGISLIVQKSATTTNCGTVASPASDCSAVTGNGTVCTF